jgi:hypothetical protein
MLTKGQDPNPIIRPADEESGSEGALGLSSILGALPSWSLPRRVCVASAALFAGLAARGAEAAEAGNWNCCNLARLDRWCGSCSTCDPPFWCNYGGFKRVWYCCQGATLYGCGECISSTGSCYSGPDWYCSYGWFEGHLCA